MKEIKDTLKGVTFTYDNLHRLLSETNNSGGTYSSNTYTYDNIGNIKTKKIGTTPIYTYNYNGPQKHAVSTISVNGAAAVPFGYDVNGNMLGGPDFTDTANRGDRVLTYNMDNMPTRIDYTKNSTTTISQFTYDGSGTRAKKAVDGGSTTYYVNPDYEVKDGVVTKYISAADQKIAQIKGTDVAYYHKDHLNSSTVMTNAAGVKAEGTEYAPYGTIRTRTGDVVSNYRYTGKELDTETGLYYYGARYYDPMIGRFITADPALDEYLPQGEKKTSKDLPAGGVYNPANLALYSYAANNPLKYIDPDGNYFIEVNLTTNRNNAGTLKLYNDYGVKIGEYVALGRGSSRDENLKNHNNRTMEYADTPTGTYKITGRVETSVNDSTFGPARLRLTGIEGQAKEAYDNGRSGIAVHGGDELPDDRPESSPDLPGRRLNYTWGCIRVSNESMNDINNKTKEIEKNRGTLYQLRNKAFDYFGISSDDTLKVKDK